MKILIKVSCLSLVLICFFVPHLLAGQVDIQKQKELFDCSTKGNLVNLTPKFISSLKICSDGPFFIVVGTKIGSDKEETIKSRDLEFSIVRGNGSLALLTDPLKKKQENILIHGVSAYYYVVLFYPASNVPALIKAELKSDKGAEGEIEFDVKAFDLDKIEFEKIEKINKGMESEWVKKGNNYKTTIETELSQPVRKNNLKHVQTFFHEYIDKFHFVRIGDKNGKITGKINLDAELKRFNDQNSFQYGEPWAVDDSNDIFITGDVGKFGDFTFWFVDKKTGVLNKSIGIGDGIISFAEQAGFNGNPIPSSVTRNYFNFWGSKIESENIVNEFE